METQLARVENTLLTERISAAASGTLRADDGIHFTTAGYELIAEKIASLFPAAASDEQPPKEP